MMPEERLSRIRALEIEESEHKTLVKDNTHEL